MNQHLIEQHLKTLGLLDRESLTKKNVHDQYRLLAKKYHPDVLTSSQANSKRFIEVQAAAEYIEDHIDDVAEFLTTKTVAQVNHSQSAYRPSSNGTQHSPYSSSQSKTTNSSDTSTSTNTNSNSSEYSSYKTGSNAYYNNSDSFWERFQDSFIFRLGAYLIKLFVGLFVLRLIATVATLVLGFLVFLCGGF